MSAANVGTTLEVDCQGAGHVTGVQGHDPDAPATHHVDMGCVCGWALRVALCGARVRVIRASQCTMTCPGCGAVRPWREVWRDVTPIELPRIGQAEPVAVAPRTSDDLITAFERYLESRRRAPGTIRMRVRHVKQLGSAVPSLDAATPEQLDSYMRERGEGRAAATVNSEIKSLRAFYGWADRFGLIRPDPTTLLDLVPNPHRMGRTVSDEEVSRILRDASPRLRALVSLGRFGGLRLSEMTTLHTSARAGDWLTIIGKGSKQRRIFMAPALRAALDAITPPDRGFYFPGGTDGHMHPQSVNKIIRREAGINPHALRHAAGTAVYRATGDLRAAQTFLGHATPGTTSIYVHVEESTLMEATRAGAVLNT